MSGVVHALLFSVPRCLVVCALQLLIYSRMTAEQARFQFHPSSHRHPSLRSTTPCLALALRSLAPIAHDSQAPNTGRRTCDPPHFCLQVRRMDTRLRQGLGLGAQVLVSRAKPERSICAMLCVCVCASTEVGLEGPARGNE